MNQVKKQPRRFSVLTSNDLSRTMKFIMPLDMYSNEYIQDNVVKSCYGTDYQNYVYDFESYNKWSSDDTHRHMNFFKLAKVSSGKILFLQPYATTDAHSRNRYRLKINDAELYITSSLFDFLKNRFGLKYYEDTSRLSYGDPIKVMLVDDSMISDDLTESLCEVGKMVKSTEPEQIWGTETLLGYHYSAWHPKVASNFTKYMDKEIGAINFGFEAEKQDYNYRDKHNAIKLAFETGFKKERDGSLGDGGFELISPILPLYNDSVINTAIDSVKDLLKAETSDRCGGHFNISMNGVSSREILKKVKGSLPIFYSIYENRLTNTYCKAERFSTYLRSPRKYQSFYLKNEQILEFRIFPAIKNETILRNRIELMRIVLGELYGKTHNGVILQMAKKGTNIYNFMLNVVCNGDMDKFKNKIKKFIVMSERYKVGMVTAHTIKKVEKMLDMSIITPTAPVETPIEVSSVEDMPEQYRNYASSSSYITYDPSAYQVYSVNTGESTIYYTGDTERLRLDSHGFVIPQPTTSEPSTEDETLEEPFLRGANATEDTFVDRDEEADIQQDVYQIRSGFNHALTCQTIDGSEPTSEQLDTYFPASIVNSIHYDMFNDVQLSRHISRALSFNFVIYRLMDSNNFRHVFQTCRETFETTEEAHESIDSEMVLDANDPIDMGRYEPHILNKYLKLFMLMCMSAKITNTTLFRNDFVFYLVNTPNSNNKEHYISFRASDDGIYSARLGRRWDGQRFNFIYNAYTETLNLQLN